MRLRSVRTCLGLWLCLSTLPWVSYAQEVDSALLLRSKRLVRRFDFEEAKHNNFEDLPMYWYVMGRPAITTDAGFMRQPLHGMLVSKGGFPAYTAVGFDKPQREPGEHRLELGLNGGSVGAFLEVGALPAVPFSDYLITAKVRTSTLRYARARLVAYFVDNTGRRIEQSVATSDLIQTDGRDQVVSVKLYGDYSEAAWIGIQTELLQPQRQPGREPGKHEVFYEEVDGYAWFDDISVWQLPYLAVEFSNRVNIIRSPDKLRLRITVRDLTSRPLIAQVKLYDHRLEVVAQSRRQVHEWAPANWKWEPPVDKFGWYLADLKVLEPAHQKGKSPVQIARTITTVLWLPEESVLNAGDAHRFRLIAEDASENERKYLPQILDRAHLDSVIISGWDRQTTVVNVDHLQRDLGETIQTIISRGRQVSVSLSPVPETVVQSHDVGEHDPIGLFDKPSDVWVPYLTPVLMRHGQRVRQWQLGSVDYPLAFFVEDLPSRIESIYRDFRDMSPQPQLLLPWRLDQSRRRDVSSDMAYMIDVPVSVAPKWFGDYMGPWLESPSVETWLHLREPPATELAHQKRIEDLVLRMLYGWELGPTGLAISRPWASSKGRRLNLLPSPLLGVFSTVAHRLAGRRVIGHLPLGDGLECMILNGPEGGLLAAWNRAAPVEEAAIDMFLGPSPRSVDVWGNRASLPIVEGRHRVALSGEPIFIEGIDPELAMFRASFKIEPSFIESNAARQDRVVRFSNPWPYTITGHLTFTHPEKWEISPTRHHFSLAAGQSAAIPVEINFPVAELVGRKRLIAHFDFTAFGRYVVDVFAPMRLGLSYLDFDATLAIETDPATGRRDVVVTQMITNKSDGPLALYAFARLPGNPSQERIVPKLESGQTVIRRFRFRDSADQLEKYSVRVGVRESTGPGVLNMALSADDL